MSDFRFLKYIFHIRQMKFEHLHENSFHNEVVVCTKTKQLFMHRRCERELCPRKEHNHLKKVSNRWSK